MIDGGKRNILGVHVNVVDEDSAVQRILCAARLRAPLTVTTLAVHGVMSGVLDRGQRYRLNALDLVCPDGQPVRWALNRIHDANLRRRVHGPSLMLEICKRAASEGLPVFLLGGHDGLPELLDRALCFRFPSLRIVGTRASRFRTLTLREWDDLVAEIRESGAAIVFVGLGCPRQEVFLYEAKEALSLPLIAVGPAFSYHSGLASQAPAFMQNLGLAWMFRLLREPRRLWRRYLLLNPLYVVLILLQALGRSDFDDNSENPPALEVLHG